MNAPGTAMKDEDIYAFNPVPKPPAPPAPPRRLWPWVLGGALLLTLVLLASGAAALVSLLDSAREGVHISIGGEDWTPGVLDGLGGLAAVAGVGFGLLVALLCVLLVVPLTLLLVALGLALGVGGALLAAGLVAALLLSPLWLLVLVLWLALRPRRPATMRT